MRAASLRSRGGWSSSGSCTGRARAHPSCDAALVSIGIEADHGPFQTVDRLSHSSEESPCPTTRVVVLLGSLRAASLNRRIAETLRDQAPAGTVVEIAEGLGDLPFYNEEIDTEGDVPAAARACATRSPAPTGCSP